MKIGHSTIPRMRMPALVKGKLFLFDLGSLQGQWGIVCDLPPFDFADAVFLNQYHRTVKKQGAALLGMLPCEGQMLDPSLPKAKALGIPLVADPLQRLRRVLGLSSTSHSNRCQSFIFDPQGVIRYHLIHLLNWRGMSFLVDILKNCQELYPQAIKPGLVTKNPLVLKQPQATRTRLPRMSTPSLNHAEGTSYATESTSQTDCL